MGLAPEDLSLDFYSHEAFSFAENNGATFTRPIKIESDVPEIVSFITDLTKLPPTLERGTPGMFANEIFLRTLYANIKKFDFMIANASSDTNTSQLHNMRVKRQIIVDKYNELCAQHGYNFHKITSEQSSLDSAATAATHPIT